MCLCVSEYVCLYVCVCVCVFVCLCVREREREREKAPRIFNRKTHVTCSSHIAEKYPSTHTPPSTHTHTDTHTPPSNHTHTFCHDVGGWGWGESESPAGSFSVAEIDK